MKKANLFFLATLLVMVVTACGPEGVQEVAQARGPRAWIDAPLDGSHLPLAAYEVVYHGTDPGGVTQLELSVNGAVVASSPSADAAETLVTVRYNWEPAAAGNYTLQARAQGRSGAWGEHATAVVVVGEVETPTPTPTPSEEPTLPPTPETPVPTPEEPAPVPPTDTPIPPTDTPVLPTPTPVTPTPTPTPVTPTPTPPQGPTVTFMQATPDTIYSDGWCGENKVSLRVLVEDPSSITGVTVHYRLKDKSSGEETSWDSRAMTRIAWEPETAANWIIQLDGQTDFAGTGWSREYTLQYYFVATNGQGISTQSDTFENVTLDTKVCQPR